MFGFLNIYKPKGMTSHDVVSVLRKIIKIKQIGHTGTLDPFAEGVLPICIGKATRLIEYLDDEKAYIGTVQFGAATTTYDIEGDVTKTSSKEISNEDIEKALLNFEGEIEQMPPIFSAIKVNGKKLYEYARNGEEVEIKPRKICINEIKLLKFDKQTNQAEIYIDCSKGTYIRSIANDLGENLEVFGHLIKLVRVKAGSFKIETSTKLEDLKTKEDIEKILIPPLEKLNLDKVELNENEYEKISHGMKIKKEIKDGIIILIYQNNLISIAESQSSEIKPLKVFI